MNAPEYPLGEYREEVPARSAWVQFPQYGQGSFLPQIVRIHICSIVYVAVPPHLFSILGLISQGTDAIKKTSLFEELFGSILIYEIHKNGLVLLIAGIPVYRISVHL